MTSYALRSPIFLTGASYGVSFIRDMSREEAKRRVDFHVASGDYFGTLSTVVRLVADRLGSGDATSRARSAATLQEVSEDLMYLQQNHSITRKR